MNTEFLNNISSYGVSKISPTSFSVSIILSFLLSFLLSQVYRKQSNSISNPDSLARIFPILSIGTTIIIAVVKSSLALSLGLVGALSIVRFRTPIKEPEELTYIFLCIGIGLATGSDQYQIAIIGFLLTLICIYINKMLSKKQSKQKTLSITINGIEKNGVEKVIDLLSKNAYSINFNSLYTEREDSILKVNLSLTFIPKDFKEINNVLKEISSSFPSCTLNIIDNNIYY